MKGWGIVLFIFGAIGFVDSASDFDLGGCVLAVAFLLGGLSLIIKAKKRRKEAERMKQYISIIVNGNVRSLDEIASTTGKSYDDVRKDVEILINKGYLDEAYINENTQEVVLPEFDKYSNLQKGQSTTSTKVSTRVIACPSCGAKNTVTGDVGECEYCGSSLK